MNNPPAFPQSLEIHVPDGDAYTRVESHPGMTLRDYFAGKAMGGVIIAHPDMKKRVGADKTIAEIAYHLADAMLAEREKAK